MWEEMGGLGRGREESGGRVEEEEERREEVWCWRELIQERRERRGGALEESEGVKGGRGDELGGICGSLISEDDDEGRGGAGEGASGISSSFVVEVSDLDCLYVSYLLVSRSLLYEEDQAD